MWGTTLYVMSFQYPVHKVVPLCQFCNTDCISFFSLWKINSFPSWEIFRDNWILWNVRLRSRAVPNSPPQHRHGRVFSHGRSRINSGTSGWKRAGNVVTIISNCEFWTQKIDSSYAFPYTIILRYDNRVRSGLGGRVGVSKLEGPRFDPPLG